MRRQRRLSVGRVQHQEPVARGPVGRVEPRLEVVHRVHDGARTAILAPLVERADLLATVVRGRGSLEQAVLGVVVGCFASPVGVDVVPVVDHQRVQLVGEGDAVLRDLHDVPSMGGANSCIAWRAACFSIPWSLENMNAVAPRRAIAMASLRSGDSTTTGMPALRAATMMGSTSR